MDASKSGNKKRDEALKKRLAQTDELIREIEKSVNTDYASERELYKKKKRSLGSANSFLRSNTI